MTDAVLKNLAHTLRQQVIEDESSVARVLLKNLRLAGYVVVPYETTAAMRRRGAYIRENGKPIEDIWRAMIDEALL